MKEHIFDKLYSLKKLRDLLPPPKEALLVFDIDYTLIHPNEPAFQFLNFVKNKSFLETIFNTLSHGERDIFSNLMVFHLCGNGPIEKEGPQIIKHLQNEGYRTIALTASMTASLKNECLIQKRIDNLRQLGFDFSHTFPEIESQYFSSLDQNYKTKPYFEKGILFSNGENPKNYKGEVLVQFLQLIDWQPKQIILIDDRLHNLQTVHHALCEYSSSIKFLGLHFLGALDYPSQEVSSKEFSSKVESIAREAREIYKSFK